MIYLENTNPNREWVQRIFGVNIDLVGGGRIQLNFDLATLSDSAYPEQIRRFVDVSVPSLDLSIREAIVDSFLLKMEVVSREVLFQSDLSLYLLDALRDKNSELAAKYLTYLIESLTPYKPESTQIWGQWVKDVGVALGIWDMP